MNKNETHLTGRLRFFSKSNVVSKASSCAQRHALKSERAYGLQTARRLYEEADGPTLPAAFLNALVQRVLRGLYLLLVKL